jgi:phosphate starvation-inducible protein PhoH
LRPSQPFLEKEGPKDIVRHKLVTKIVEAYEKYEVATSDELQATSKIDNNE